jgi:hypothetical protein
LAYRQPCLMQALGGMWIFLNNYVFSLGLVDGYPMY